MSTHTSLQDRNRETRIFFGRAVVAGLVVIALMLTLVGRMAHLQIVNHQHYSTLSQQNRVRVVPVPPTRGLIYDRNGVVLAENRPSFRLVITPEQVQDLNATLTALGEIIELDESDLTRFHQLRTRQRRFEEVPLKVRLSEEEIAALAINRHRFPGVEVRAQLTRHYPLGEEAVHAIGYVGRINAQELQRIDRSNYAGTTHIGKTGIERYYEDRLHGKVGLERVETNASGRAIRVLERTPPIPGEDIYLTLDIELQRAAEAALEGETGAIVAMEPSTGEVLAFVSNPTFDPNLFVNGIDIDVFRELQSDRRRPLFNRALRGQYPPGSTTKPIVALAALENGTIGAEERVFCRGFYTLPGQDHRYRCWNRSGHGATNLTDALVESCDVWFYEVAFDLGIDAMSSFMEPFNFGRPTGIDLIGESRGILPSREWKRQARGEGWFHGETIINSIGQGFNLATPTQLAYSTAIIANRGYRVPPRLLLGSRAPGEAKIQPVDPDYSQPPIVLQNPAHWDDIIKGMELSITGARGTARRISRNLSYTVAGKTGTSQVFSLAQDQEYDAEALARELHNHALFVAFAPIENPRIAVAVIVEHGGGGGSVAAPVARQVLDAYLLRDENDAE
ncbi:penicillin-binding protein 2 [Alkalilimnicola ehrlichii]|uniref:Peptidoglycan D,D-transpeptidase MrdA n=1 Tax=Alkalilimnicola ehrlichii TaxID=351052 RepID=A0A3E0X401_9GAMM|nr:penicillin-binding protein 2 [Alkalilimnicola ehrlichii]RFA31283.1 penicillin-binding protein 2 [Alkalilimnicola ehrlichii]RFA39444.1 penicillin-binding protein 2 [Alkalilimnicola ehrlichii]